MNKIGYFMKKHSSTILTVIGAAGVIGTSVLAVKATPKALELIKEAEEEKGEKLTKLEVVKVAWKPYVPAVVTGLSTITCIFGANHLSTKQQRSLMAAYTLLDKSFKQYRSKTEDLSDINIMQEIIGSEFDENRELNEDKLLFYEHQSRRFFESTMEEVMQAECAYLELLENRGYASLNEYYDLLGIPHIPHGYQLSWFDVEDNDPYDCHRLEFDYKKTILKDKYECFVISTNMPPADDYVY